MTKEELKKYVEIEYYTTYYEKKGCDKKWYFTILKTLTFTILDLIQKSKFYLNIKWKDVNKYEE